MRKYKFLALIFCFAALYGSLLWAAFSPTLPSPSNPLILYSNQKRDDLHLVLKQSFTSASRSIAIWMYSATDPLLLTLLQKKATEGTHVSIHVDKRGGSPVLPLIHTIKSKGLMHRKIVIIDNHTVFLGSANMTPSSLQLHDNLSVGIYNPLMAQFLQNPPCKTYSFSNGLLWLLPDKEALLHLKKKIDAAHTSIFIAMFTLTQKDLIDALIQAKKRGVDVQLALDRYTAQGASKKAAQKLSAAGVTLFLNAGLPLLHHKWAYIDHQELILGSTNWTEAAFCKNDDLLLFLHPLPSHIHSKLSSLINAIQMESNKRL